MRSLQSVTIEITEVETQPVGLTEPGKILVVPQDNLSLMLRGATGNREAGRLLSSENKNYCNLVESNLENTEQQAEVYFIVEALRPTLRVWTQNLKTHC